MMLPQVLIKKNSPSSSVWVSAQSDSKGCSLQEQFQIQMLSSNCEPINEIKRTSQSKIIKNVAKK